MKRFLIVAVALFAATALIRGGAVGPPAAASAGNQPTPFTVYMYQHTYGWTFSARSLDGAFCDAGWVTNAPGEHGVMASPQLYTWHVDAVLTCFGDGSDSITLSAQVRHDLQADQIDGAVRETLNWNVASGTGHYTGVRGSGSGIQQGLSPAEFTAVWWGYITK